MNESLNYINKCHYLLKKLNLIESNYQFSRQFLNKSKHYYALCQAGREPSINSLCHLTENIQQLNDTLFNKNKGITQLINEGKSLINKRIQQWYQ